MFAFGIRKCTNLLQNTCKIIRSTTCKPANNCVLENQIWKTAPVTRSLTSSVFSNSFVKNVGLLSFPRNRLFAATPLLKLPVTLAEQSRTLIKFSRRKCKRKTSKTIIRRFYRLHWGAWIRTIAGKNKHRWRKSIKRRQRNKQHFFCNRQQSRLLDHMTASYWKKRRFYVDDPYEPYHSRHNITRSNNR